MSSREKFEYRLRSDVRAANDRFAIADVRIEFDAVWQQITLTKTNRDRVCASRILAHCAGIIQCDTRGKRYSRVDLSADFPFQKHVGAMEFKKFLLRFSKPADVHDAIGGDAHFLQ